jgi:hypothetical protein
LKYNSETKLITNWTPLKNLVPLFSEAKCNNKCVVLQASKKVIWSKTLRFARLPFQLDFNWLGSFERFISYLTKMTHSNEEFLLRRICVYWMEPPISTPVDAMEMICICHDFNFIIIATMFYYSCMPWVRVINCENVDYEKYFS